MNSKDVINEMDATNATDAVNSTDPTNGGNLKSWYVIQTKPGNEDRVKGNLVNQEIEAFLPLMGTYQYRSGKMIQRIRPLFPSYLFARLDLGVHFSRVKYTRGVSKVLGSKEGPTPIADKVVETIKERIGEDHLVKLDDELQDGDLVQVTSGPLKDLTGVFQKKTSGKGRVKILLSLIGVDVPVQLSRWQLKKVR